MPKAYRVPKEIQRIAARAIEYNNSLPISQRAAYKDVNGERKPGTGMRTARRLVSGNVDAEQVFLMRAWFARHGESKKEAEARKDKTSKAARAWSLWGGSAARTWANKTARSITLQKMIDKKKQ